MNLKKIILIITLILIISLVLISTLYYLIKIKQLSINKFFISENDIIGVDLSKYQGEVDMKKIKNQNIKFVYIKATEGSTHTDEKFHKNWANAEENNLIAGAYHFFSFDSSGQTQAQNYIKTVGELKGKLIPVVDVEYYGDKEENPPTKEEIINELQIYLDTLEEEYNVKPMIYTRTDIYKKYLKGQFDDYKKWISSLYLPLKWEYKDNWDIWQYTDRAKLEGYKGKEKYIDLNVINKEIKLESLIVK